MSLSGDAHFQAQAPALQLALAPTQQAPSLARAAIARLTDTRLIDTPTLATLTLLVSELVTNAVIHPDVEPPGDIRLVARHCRGVLRVEVTDCGSGFTPRPRDPGAAHRGYGLFLLDKEATRWGVDRLGGTTVWFELALPSA